MDFNQLPEQEMERMRMGSWETGPGANAKAGAGIRLNAMPSEFNAATSQGARAALRDRIERLQREAKRLEALYKALPLELPPLAEEGLWELLAGR